MLFSYTPFCFLIPDEKKIIFYSFFKKPIFISLASAFMRGNFLYLSSISNSLYILKQETLSSIIPQISPNPFSFVCFYHKYPSDSSGFTAKMAAWDGVLSKNHIGDEDFDEEEVWGLAEERDESSPKGMKKKVASKDSSGSSSAWHSPAAARKIPRSSSQTSHRFEALQGSSAPLNIPDWSKIYQKNVKRGSKIVGEEEHEHDNGGGDEEEEDGDEDEDRIIPPHEWLARKLARNQISSFSVCEGVGRTLKGRDLSKVRNAVLSKTGFIE